MSSLSVVERLEKGHKVSRFAGMMVQELSVPAANATEIDAVASRFADISMRTYAFLFVR